MKTLIGSVGIRLFLTLIPAWKFPVIDDALTSVLIGVINGVGVGLILLAGGSGGVDMGYGQRKNIRRMHLSSRMKT